MAEQEERPCSVCNEPGVFLCSRCCQPYCSMECQKFDWPTHKRVCFPMPRLIKASYVIAASSQDLEPGLDDVCLSTKHRVQLAQLGKRKTTTTIEIDKATSASGIDDKTPISHGYQQEQVSAKLSDFTSNLIEIPRMTSSEPLFDPRPKQINVTTSSTLNEIWMKPFPIEENVFVPVVVQFASRDPRYAWVMLEKNKVARNNLLRDINYDISTAPNVQANEIKINQLYLVPHEDIYYRGVCLQFIKSVGFVLIRLIDYGNEITIPNDTLKEASSATKSLNAFAFQIKFQTPRKVEIGDTLNIRIKCISNGNSINVVVESENNFVTKDDLEVIPIPVGIKTDLFCLDFSNIGKGYVSACVNDTKAIDNIEAINERISAYCKCSQDSYHPLVNELCLAKYEDGAWYRGGTLKVIESDVFRIMFLDYGNITTLNSSDIRKMPEEFMHHCLMNVCFIEGAPEKPQDDYIEKTSSYFSEHQVFPIESAVKDKDVYLINVPELQW